MVKFPNSSKNPHYLLTRTLNLSIPIPDSTSSQVVKQASKKAREQTSQSLPQPILCDKSEVSVCILSIRKETFHVLRGRGTYLQKLYLGISMFVADMILIGVVGILARNG